MIQRPTGGWRVTQGKPPRKPHWLSPDQWSQLWALHGGAPTCFDCGTSERLSVDHIRPRKFDGTHDLSNLCFRCLHHNDEKGVKPDGYWSKSFYFDQAPEVQNLRALQRRLLEAAQKSAQVLHLGGLIKVEGLRPVAVRLHAFLVVVVQAAEAEVGQVVGAIELPGPD